MKEKNLSEFAKFKGIVWHESFWILLQKIAEYAETGGRGFTCGDNVWRLLLPLTVLHSQKIIEKSEALFKMKYNTNFIF